MTNAKVAETLELMSLLLELEGANPFRVRAYQRAAQAVSGLPQPVKDVPHDDLLEVPGIGAGISAHIEELCRTGRMAELETLRAKFPPGVLDMLTSVEGLGPKRVKQLYQTLQIDSLEKLKAAASQGQLRLLSGFGPKMEEKILKGLSFAAETHKRLIHWDARLLAQDLLAQLRVLPGVRRAEAAGSLRRRKETVGDLDLLCAAARGAEVVERFVKLPSVERVLAQGPTKATVRLKDQIQCDLRVVAPSSFGAAWLYFTGSKDHNVALRERAQKLGLTVNEYGVFKAADKGKGRPLAGATEEEVYARLGLDWVPPELRENRGEIEAAAEHRLPDLVELEDVRGDFHNHTHYTDGLHSMEEMARAAEKMGWEWVAIGDHSRSLRVAGGLSVPDLRRTIAENRRLAARFKSLKLMRSMEVDILKDGSLDYPDEVLDEIDVVIGSVHSHFSLPEAEMTERIVRAVRHRGMDILGHLSGRLINRRPEYKVDPEAVFKAAAEAGTAVELNGQPARQDLDDVRARRAKELGVPLALDTDAHRMDQFPFMEVAVGTARRAGLEKKDVLNCMGYKELREWLADRTRRR